MNPLHPPSLYDICFQNAISILKTGLWNRIDGNPFSLLPSSIVNDLMKSALSLPFRERLKINNLLLLITSGKLTELDLMLHGLEVDSNTFLNAMSKNVCKNFRSFSIPTCLREDDSLPLAEVLSSCINLENVHSALHFDLDILENCPNLRSLRFHLPMNQMPKVSLDKIISSTRALTKIETFALCATNDSFLSCKFVAKVLLGFPNLISVGLVDSSLPLKIISKTTTSFPLHLKLRRCFWGLSHDNYLRVTDTKKLFIYRKAFTKLIKMAVLSCPNTEELVINVYHEECLQYLCLLQHLTFLSISFAHCKSDYMSVWLSVLKEIGPQLKHLSVEGSSPIPVNVICDYCPNLESLRIRGKAIVSGTVPDCPKLPHLRRLLLVCMSEESLIYLLSNCPLLSEIFLDCALCLDDTVLGEILRQNPLLQLQVVEIYACKLSRLGLQLLLESAVKLEKISFKSVIFHAPDVLHKLNRNIEKFQNFNRLKDVDFFQRKLHPCHF